MEVATKPPQTPSRSADKLIEALATLGALLDRTINEVRALDRDFQQRLKQTVQETEVALQAQSVQQIEATRQEVSDTLTARFHAEIQTAVESLRSEFSVERDQLLRQLQEMSDMAAQLQAERARLTAEVQRVREDGEAGILRVKEAGVAELESLRHELTARFRKESQLETESLTVGFEEERDRLLKDVRRGADAVARLESEKDNLMQELQWLREEAASQLEKVREEMGSNSKKELQEAIGTVTAQSNAERERLVAEWKSAHAERERLGAECERLTDERDRLNRELRASTERGARIAAEVDELAAQIVQARADGLAGMEKVRDESSARFQKESHAATAALKEAFAAERDTLNKELRHAIDAAARLEAERSGLLGEVQRIKDKAAADVERARAAEAAAAAESLNAKANSSPRDTSALGATSESVQSEIERIEAQVREALKVIDDPGTDLPEVIRRNVERTELEAYLRGIRYAIGR